MYLRHSLPNRLLDSNGPPMCVPGEPLRAPRNCAAFEYFPTTRSRTNRLSPSKTKIDQETRPAPSLPRCQVELTSSRSTGSLDRVPLISYEDLLPKQLYSRPLSHVISTSTRCRQGGPISSLDQNTKYR